MTQYEKIAGKFTDPRRMEHPFRRMLYKRWLEQCGKLDGKSVLDFGCEGGDSTRLLARAGARVWGIDEEPRMVEIAQQKESAEPLGIKYLLRNGIDMGVIGQFDLVTPTNVLHYSNTVEELRRMIVGIYANLKPGGRMVGFNSDPTDPVTRYWFPEIPFWLNWIDESFVEGSRIRITLTSPGNPTFVNHWWDKRTYERIFQEAGFVDIKWTKPRFLREERPEKWRDMENNCVLTIISAKKPQEGEEK